MPSWLLGYCIFIRLLLNLHSVLRLLLTSSGDLITIYHQDTLKPVCSGIFTADITSAPSLEQTEIVAVNNYVQTADLTDIKLC